MQDPVAFDSEAYNDLATIYKFQHIKGALVSIVKTINPASKYIVKINVQLIEELILEIGEYYKLFDAVISAFPEQELCSEDITFISNSCEDISCVHRELINAIQWLRVAHDELVTIEAWKSNAGYFSKNSRKEYYECLEYARTALMSVLINLKDSME